MLFYKKGQDVQLGIVIPIIGLIIAIPFTIGFFYMTMIWQLANIVSVLEKICGFKALIKSKELIKGKMGTAFALLLVMNICALPITVLQQKFGGFGIVERICFGISSLVLWTLIILFGLVVQTVFYLVCKSYHHESIDKSSLGDHLDEYLGEYVALKDESIQLEHLNV
ncbi:hypothetical protein BVRB_6g132620 [Beta vulgaris subsp. vulgaris]|nr:hypothetical protein BVRB_6g132620 [Beta vulgaris subsp. vulgaris]